MFARAKRRRCKATPPVRCLFVCLEVGPASPTPEVFNRGLYRATKAFSLGTDRRWQESAATTTSFVTVSTADWRACCVLQRFCLTFSVSLTLWTLPNFLVSQPLRKGPPRGRSAREFSVSTFALRVWRLQCAALSFSVFLCFSDVLETANFLVELSP